MEKNTHNQNLTTIGGAPEGYDARLLAEHLAKSGAPVIHIARDDTRLAETQTALQFFASDVPVFVFPAWDCLPYDRVSPNADISATRMATLATLADGFAKPFIVLTTVAAITQRVPARDVLKQSSFTATVGKQINEKELRSFFTRMGFTQAPTVMEPGDYAIRGGLIDVFPPGDSGPVRLDLFGDVLESARRFDVENQRTVAKLSRIELAPVSEVILDAASIQRFRSCYRHEFGAAGTDDPLYESVSAGRKYQGVEHWTPYFHVSLETLFDYIPDATVFMDDRTTQARLARWDAIADQYEARKQALENKSRMDSVYKPCPPELLYMDDAAFEAAVARHKLRQLVPLPQGLGPNVIDAGGRIGRNFAPERQQEEISLFGALADHIRAKREGGHVLIASFSKGARDRLTALLEDHDTLGMTNIGNWSDISADKGGLSLAVWPLEHGFEAKGLTVISEQDVLGDRLIRSGKRKLKS